MRKPRYTKCMKSMVEQYVNVKSGYTLRSSIASYARGDVLAIQAKDVIGGDLTKLASIHMENVEDYALCSGDVLLSVKGSFRALVFKEIGQPVIATSSLAVMRVNNRLINPDYLALLFNSTIGQRMLSTITKGAAIQSIPLDNLRKLVIPIPEMQKQCEMVAVANNVTRQVELLDKKMASLRQVNDSIISKMIKGVL